MEADQHQDVQAQTQKKKPRKIKGAAPTAQEILDKARREARPTTPAERVKIEAAGQCLMPGHLELPEMKAPISRFYGA